MGREADIWAEVGDEAGSVRALLESDALILRSSIRRRYLRRDLERVEVDGDALTFTCCGAAVRLHMGVKIASGWREAIMTPPPTLRSKLRLECGARAMLIGINGDVALREALDGVLVTDIGTADMIVACVEAGSDLDAALDLHALRQSLPIWAVYRKGPKVFFGATFTRERMRAAGFRDTKTCAVSEVRTATRYHSSATR